PTELVTLILGEHARGDGRLDGRMLVGRTPKRRSIQRFRLAKAMNQDEVDLRGVEPLTSCLPSNAFGERQHDLCCSTPSMSLCVPQGTLLRSLLRFARPSPGIARFESPRAN